MNPNNSQFVGMATNQGPRATLEDAFALPDGSADLTLGHLYVVADGVGGQEAGEVAAQIAVSTIQTRYYAARAAGHGIPEALTVAFNTANKAIYEESQRRGVDRMGCTAVAVAYQDDRLFVAHAGDARAYQLRGRRLRRLTRDHTWVQAQVDAGTISERDARHHELRHVVQRVMGNHPTLETEVSGSITVRDGDRILLCTDGLHDVVEEKQIAQILRNNAPQAAADKLIDAALRADTGDNVTAVVVLVSANGAVPPRRRSGLFALAAIAALAIVLLLVSQIAGNGQNDNTSAAESSITIDAPPTPTSTSLPPTSTTTAKGSPNAPARTLTILATDGAYVRAEPDVDATVVYEVWLGDDLEIGEHVSADREWVEVALPDNQRGWIKQRDQYGTELFKTDFQLDTLIVWEPEIPATPTETPTPKPTLTPTATRTIEVSPTPIGTAEPTKSWAGTVQELDGSFVFQESSNDSIDYQLQFDNADFQSELEEAAASNRFVVISGTQITDTVNVEAPIITMDSVQQVGSSSDECNNESTPQYFTYLIQSGDTLDKIKDLFGVASILEIAELNGIGNTNDIKAGDTILILCPVNGG
ncbi:MAG: protein phosphatase 2C domain-containing protein [Anaerolineae bacterium]|nr:protein phosphatase 2C domain-containing protein [Anaerolineae bacterium]MCO5205586.1 protein phosphatase 2C domain-containing protein [Anaerolineae bacterium]